MGRLFYFIFFISLLSSCSSKRPRIHKGNWANSSGIEKIEISEALSLSDQNLNTKTAVYSLENGGESLLARLWLIEHAQRSIDIQYFSFAKDVTGLIVCDRIISAADRGVRVRILIDDIASKMYSHEVKLLNSHENIDIHIYNAGVMLGRPDRRMIGLTKNINRLLRRMHNKTMTVDAQAGILGGRNVADEYFDYAGKYNFRDRDVLLFGNSVKNIVSSFEKFWDHELSVPYSELSTKTKKKRYLDSLRFEHLHKKAATTKKFLPETREKIKNFPAEIKKARASEALIWVEKATFISDVPGKNADREKREGGVATDSLIALIAGAKKNIVIQTPYFIPTKELKETLITLLQHGVKIRLLTNSLASIDMCSAFSAYKKTRKELIKAGIEIYEFKPHPDERVKLMLPDKQKCTNYKAVFGLHSKTILIDDYTAIIGSYNLDPRSADYNTECLSLIRSAEVAQHLSKFLEEEFLPQNSWPVTKDHNPDSKAKLIKRFRAACFYLFPKKLL